MEVRLKPGESVDRLIKRFLKKVKKHNIVQEHVDKTSYFLTKSQKKRAKRSKNAFLRKKEERKMAKAQ
jgi:ribosomal protein S21